jgi:hypothetical protein
MIFLSGVTLLFVFYYQFRDALIDDAFITFSYASTLRHYFEWGFYQGWASNTATSPLNVMLIALFHVVIPDVVSAAILLTAVETYCLIIFLIKISQHQFQNNFFAILVSAGIILNPLLLSTIGLESFLFCLIFTTALLFLITQKPTQLGVALGLLTLTRPEGCLYFAIFLVYYIFHQTTRQSKTTATYHIAMPYMLTIVPWFLFSWIHLGSFIPDTFFIKIHQDWGGNMLTGFYLYFTKYPFETITSFIFAPLAFIYFRRTKGVFKYFLPLCSIAYFLCYLFLTVPPYHWYYVPIIYIGILMGGYILSDFVQNQQQHFAKTAIALEFTILLFGFGTALSGRATFPPIEAFIHSNWGNQTQYRNIAQWLSDSITASQPIVVKGEVGTIAFFCKHQTNNYFTRGIEDSIIFNRFHKTSTISKWCFSINHLFWKPHGYCAPSEWVLRINPDHRDTVQLYKERKHWLLSSRFDTTGVGIARVFSTK